MLISKMAICLIRNKKEQKSFKKEQKHYYYLKGNKSKQNKINN